MSFLRFESYRRGLAASTACNLLAQAAGFVTLLIFARHFGAQPQTDVFLYATASLSAAAMLITGTNASVVIPEFMRLSTQEDRGRAMAFANGWLLIYAGVAAALGLALFAWPDAFLSHGSRFSPETAAAGRAIVLLVAPILPAEALATALADLVVAQRYFTIPMLCTLVTRLVQLACILLFHEALGVRSMALGTLIGLALQIAALLALLRLRLGWRFRPRLSAVGAQVFRHAGFACTGNLLSSVAYWVPQYLLTGLGAGVVSAANYATRVVNIPQALLVNHVASVTGIKMNDLHARRQPAEVSRTFLRATQALIFLLAPAAAWLSLGAADIVRLLFERGSFDASATAEAAHFLRFLALGLPLLAINTVAARAFMAAQCIVPPFWYQLAQNAICLAAVYAGIHLAGARGYLVALLLYQVWNTLTLLPMIRGWLPFLSYGRTLASLAVAAAACAALALAAAELVRVLPPLPTIARLALQASVFAMPLLALNARFRFSEDLAALVDLLFRGTTRTTEPGRE